MPYYELTLIRAVRQRTHVTVSAESYVDAGEKVSFADDPPDEDWETINIGEPTYVSEIKKIEE